MIAAIKMAENTTISIDLKIPATVSCTGFFFFAFLFNGKYLKVVNTSKPKPCMV